MKGWEETVIKSLGEEGEELDARISVPAMPSPYVVAFLFAGCREIHRIGGHVLDRAVLELFAWELLDKVSLWLSVTVRTSILQKNTWPKFNTLR